MGILRSSAINLKSKIYQNVLFSVSILIPFHWKILTPVPRPCWQWWGASTRPQLDLKWPRTRPRRRRARPRDRGATPRVWRRRTPRPQCPRPPPLSRSRSSAPAGRSAPCPRPALRRAGGSSAGAWTRLWTSFPTSTMSKNMQRLLQGKRSMEAHWYY